MWSLKPFTTLVRGLGTTTGSVTDDGIVEDCIELHEEVAELLGIAHEEPLDTDAVDRLFDTYAEDVGDLTVDAYAALLWNANERVRTWGACGVK